MMSYKWCAVPACTNTSIKTPEKLFVSVPRNVKIRKKWLQLARRDPEQIKDSSVIFFCEDHFDMEKNIANYMQYKMGFSQKIILADKAMPTKFHCQEDRKRRQSDGRCSRKGYLKRQRIDLVRECLQMHSAAENLQKDEDMKQEIVDPVLKEKGNRKCVYLRAGEESHEASKDTIEVITGSEKEDSDMGCDMKDFQHIRDVEVTMPIGQDDYAKGSSTDSTLSVGLEGAQEVTIKEELCCESLEENKTIIKQEEEEEKITVSCDEFFFPSTAAEHCHQQLNPTSSTTQHEDPDYKFFMSLFPVFKQLKPSDKAMIKAQIQQLISWKLPKTS